MSKRTKLAIALTIILAGTTLGIAATKKTSAPKPKTAQTVALPRLLELGADRCVPCKMMKPIIDELSKEYQGKVQIDFIDVWKNPGEAEKYQVRSIPTQVFFDREGKEVFRHIGFFSKDAITEKFTEMGIK